VSVSIIGWLKPGTKATAHEHAFLGLRTLIVEYQSGVVGDMTALRDYGALLSIPDYEYVDKTPHA
jgi:hypothetical protein